MCSTYGTIFSIVKYIALGVRMSLFSVFYKMLSFSLGNRSVYWVGLITK